MSTHGKEQFFSTGLQYHIAARFSALAWFTPACGNLFHHAIEMFLKGHHCEKMSLSDLKTNFGHNLNALWTEFKKDVGDKSLDRFDQTISDIHQFESIRYPDQILSLGMQSYISIDQRHTGTGGTSRVEPKYQIVVSEIDELVREIFKAASVNPLFFTGSMSNHARIYLKEQNNFPLG